MLERDYIIRSPAAMSVNNVDAEASTRPTWPHSRPPTIRDLRTKSCWICLSESGPLTSRPKTKQGWIHACSCTLVAHESCLLQWIASAESNRTGGSNAIKCPQCGTKYIIKSKKPALLRLLNRGYHQVTRLYRTGALLSSCTSLILMTSTYGAVSLRCFLGKEAFEYYFGTELQGLVWHAIEFTFVPVALLLSSTTLADSIFPIIPMLFMPSTMSHDHLMPPLDNLIRYPPSPTTTLLALPYVRLAYKHVWRKAAAWVTSTVPRRHNRLEGVADIILQFQHEDPGEGVDPILDINIEEEGDLERPEDAAGAVGNEDGDGVAENQAQGNNRAEVIRMTDSYALRAFLSTLVAPLLSAGFGEILRLASNRSPLLRKALGIRDAQRIVESSKFGFTSSLGKIMPLGLNISIQNMDPVWWRNAIGISLYIALSDAVTLLHVWLAVRERRSRRIVSRDFSGLDYSQLDLII